MRRHQRKGFNKDDCMVEEFKGGAVDQDDSDNEAGAGTSKLLKVRGGAAAEANFEDGGDNESDYED